MVLLDLEYDCPQKLVFPVIKHLQRYKHFPQKSILSYSYNTEPVMQNASMQLQQSLKFDP